MLVEILREAQALLAVTRATLTAWEQGDEKTLTDLLFGNSNGDAALGEFYERVFYGRNRTMADRIVALSADAKPRFVVVGTGHLIGPQGVPELLAQRGFRVERVGSARVLPGADATPAESIPAPAVIPVERSKPAPADAPILPPVTPAPADAPIPPPVTPDPAPSLAPPSRALPVQPSGAPQDSWLGQDAESAPQQGEPAPGLMEPLPAPPEAVPAPAETPTPAPPPAKPKKKRMSTTKR
jgi:hypothetical protein